MIKNEKIKMIKNEKNEKNDKIKLTENKKKYIKIDKKYERYENTPRPR